MPAWLDKARQRHNRFQSALAASLPSYSIPVGDSDYTAPGHLYYGHFFSCVPDSAYPWDPEVLAAIRDFCPDVMPLTIRSVWRLSNYGDMGDFFTITRHGIGRAIRDPKLPTQNFYCQMPSTHIPGLCIPGRSISDCRPNYIELEWYDKEVRPWGRDLPGAYLPFDWELYYALRADYFDGSRESGASMAERIGSEYRSRRLRRKLSRISDYAYRRKDFEKYYSIEPSEVELKEKIAGNY